MGRHSKLEVGTGEAMVDQAVAMLDALYDAAPPPRRTSGPLASSTR